MRQNNAVVAVAITRETCIWEVPGSLFTSSSSSGVAWFSQSLEAKSFSCMCVVVYTVSMHIVHFYVDLFFS
jgi:hypothetical protein